MTARDDGTTTRRDDDAPRGDSTTLATIYYTADLYTPDDSDTNVYGEACEPGYGETMEQGWHEPDWSTWTVFETKDQVRPDTIESDDDRFDNGFTLDDLIEQDITARLGAIDSFDGETAYGSDPHENYTTGQRLMVAAHIEIHETDNETDDRSHYIGTLNIHTGEWRDKRETGETK